MSISDEASKEVFRGGVQASTKAARASVKIIMFILDLKKVPDTTVEEAFKKLSSVLEGSVLNPQSQTIRTFKDYDLTATGEQLRSFDQISINCNISYAVYQDNTNPDRRMIFLQSNRGEMQDIKSALQEYSQRARLDKKLNRIPLNTKFDRIRNDLAQQKSMAKDLIPSISQSKLPTPKL